MNGGKIYAAIAAAMAEISPIAKGKKNAGQGFMYRGIDDVMNELSPILAKHKIFIYPEVASREREERQAKSGGNNIYSILTVKYHFATDDGSEICVTVVGEGMDTGDKASNKAMAVAYKYACLQVFCIPTEDMSDSDGNSPPPSAPKGGPKNNAPPPRSEKDNGQGNRSGVPPEIQVLIDDMGRILKEKSPDNLPFFTDGERAANKELVIAAKRDRKAGDIKKLHEILLKELGKRKAQYKPVPFGDEFRNDIPEGMYPEEDIF